MNIKALNLVMTYPVKWSSYIVLRDYIQNFYDSVGQECFGKEFRHSYNENTEILKMYSAQSFSKDWLLYIGASSKREDISRQQVGKFGEGFKIASLVAYRDMHWDIVMESRDWKVHVTKIPGQIENTGVEVLAYEIESREYHEDAILTLSGVKAKEAEYFNSALGNFYYEDNPNFGRVLAKGNDYAVYLPAKGGLFEKYGALFAGLLKRGTVSAPLIICSHTYRKTGDGREREDFFENDIRSCIDQVFWSITPEEAAEILRVLLPQWSHGGNKKRYSFNWEESIHLLIRRVAESDQESRQFQEEYGNCLVADFARIEYGNKRRLALAWKQTDMECKKQRLVLHEFAKLGIPELDVLCRKHEGYELTREANPRENQYLKILRCIASDVFEGYTCYEELPSCRIIKNHPPQEGSAKCIKNSSKIQNIFGMSVQFRIHSICLHSELFVRESFSKAVCIYMHELLHQFGGDSSAQFRNMICQMSLRMVQAADRLSEYQKEWEKVI